MRDWATAARAIKRYSHCLLRSSGDRPTLPPTPRERTWVARVGSVTVDSNALLPTIGSVFHARPFHYMAQLTLLHNPERHKQFTLVRARFIPRALSRACPTGSSD